MSQPQEVTPADDSAPLKPSDSFFGGGFFNLPAPTEPETEPVKGDA